jgi:hypothetical protein
MPLRSSRDSRAIAIHARPLTGQREIFLHQAGQADGRSPLYAELCGRLADNPRVATIVESPPRWDAALRLLGALHNLVLRGEASWEDVDGALERHADFLRRFVAEQRVQTNEVQRCWMLLPCFLELARRTGFSTFDLIEFGPSAALLLYLDRYRYRYQAGEWGGSGASLELHGEERRPVPAELLAVELRVGSRVGIDIEPVDVTSEEGALLLRSFVWADNGERLERLDRAIEVLRRDPPALVRGDFVELVPEYLARRRDEALTLVMQIASAGYVDRSDRERLWATYEAAGQTAPLAVVSTGQPMDGSHDYWALDVTVWPGGVSETYAHGDFHGAWLEWLL